MMAVVVTNKKGGRVVVRGNANTVLQLSDFAKDESETVTAVTLTQIWGSTDQAALKYYRANTTDVNNLILTISPGDTEYLDFAGNGVKPDEDLKTANVIITITDSNTTFIAEFHKNST
jgi:hypothetical protein